MSMKKGKKEEEKKDQNNSVIVTNHEAGRDYFIIETREAGLVLTGCEVKSLRESQSSLAGSFARVDGGKPLLYNLYIAPYAQGNRENPEDPKRQRVLLLHKKEIERFQAQVAQKGMVLVPLKLYFKHGLVKVDLALGKPKKQFDKREDIKKRESDRQIDRDVKNRNRR
jgi:SsrA-binding protein